MAVRGLRQQRWPVLHRVRRGDDQAFRRGHRAPQPDRADTPRRHAPLPEPVQRAINREPVDEEDWPYDEHSLTMMLLPGGCLFTLRPRQFGG
jgi:hypothetical protein